MKTEIVRKIDELGRIVLPAEMRNAFGWESESKVAITKQDDCLILRTHRGSCFVCGNTENLTSIREKFVCKACVNELISQTPRIST